MEWCTFLKLFCIRKLLHPNDEVFAKVTVVKVVLNLQHKDRG